MTVSKLLLALVNTPVLIENGAVAPTMPLPASNVPVTPPGKVTVTSKVRSAATLGTVELVIVMLGVPRLQTLGRLFTKDAVGVGSTFTVVTTAVPLLQPVYFGVTVNVTVMKALLLFVRVPLMLTGKA